MSRLGDDVKSLRLDGGIIVRAPLEIVGRELRVRMLLIGADAVKDRMDALAAIIWLGGAGYYTKAVKRIEVVLAFFCFSFFEWSVYKWRRRCS